MNYHKYAENAIKKLEAQGIDVSAEYRQRFYDTAEKYIAKEKKLNLYTVYLPLAVLCVCVVGFIVIGVTR